MTPLYFKVGRLYVRVWPRWFWLRATPRFFRLLHIRPRIYVYGPEVYAGSEDRQSGESA